MFLRIFFTFRSLLKVFGGKNRVFSCFQSVRSINSVCGLAQKKNRPGPEARCVTSRATPDSHSHH